MKMLGMLLFKLLNETQNICVILLCMGKPKSGVELLQAIQL